MEMDMTSKWTSYGASAQLLDAYREQPQALDQFGVDLVEHRGDSNCEPFMR